MREETIDQLKSNYNHLTRKLIMLENDLETAYNKYKTKAEPNFMKNRDTQRVQTRINETRKEMEDVMSRLKLIYDDRTIVTDQSVKLFQTNNELIDTQNLTYGKNQEKIIDTSTKIQLNERQAQIEKNNISKTERNINITIITLCFIVLSFIPVGLKFTQKISKKITIIIMLVLWSTWGGLLGYVLSQDVNRTNDIWENRHFPLPTKLKTKDIEAEAEAEEESLDENLSELISGGKCN